jgi:superfamily II DNA or RNA helicase
MDLMESIRRLEEKISALDQERSSVIKELNSLRAESEAVAKQSRALLGRPIGLSSLETNPDKVRLFLNLFRARQDVFPKRWENLKTGKKGYSPVCANEWQRPVCDKPKIKCGDCPNQKFLPLDESAVEQHLRGTATIGTYAIKEDDTCVFLACDFDETSWQADASTFRDTGRDFGIDIAIERSRSGNGAHAWIFFETPVAAKLARSLGTLILAHCSENNMRLSLESYDRLFPSQDYLPRGGFGNLIALPLQRTSREMGNSCFIDDVFNPFTDQWTYLNGVRRLSHSEIRGLLSQFLPKASNPRGEGFADVTWQTDNAILEKTSELNNADHSLIDQTIEIIFGSQLKISTENLSPCVFAKLKKTASFANPEFYKLQKMRMQTYPHSRFIFSGELRPDEIILPRGVLDEVIKILNRAGAGVVIRDERIGKKRVDAEFSGTLTPLQVEAVKKIKKQDIGILMAPPGAGKTVMGCALIAERKVSTLILVHRGQLLTQWKERITSFLGIKGKEIGTLNGTKKKLTGKIDLAMIQTFTKIEDLSEIARNYSQIIIDECHHIPATSFEAILKQLPARYIVGLTATPYRKDGLEKILFQQCGPIRHEMPAVDGGVLNKFVAIHETGFKFPEELGRQPPYHVMMHHLTTNAARNKKIADLTIELLKNGRFPLLISDRKDQLGVLAKLIIDSVDLVDLEIIHLYGTFTAKQRVTAIEILHTKRRESKPVLLVATASLVGEGFDLPELDSLVLATPLSFEGRMIQYAGRLHRLSDGKVDVRILDFVDSNSAMLVKMYRNRVKTYRKMGYTIEEPIGFLGPLGHWGSGAT